MLTTLPQVIRELAAGLVSHTFSVSHLTILRRISAFEAPIVIATNRLGKGTMTEMTTEEALAFLRVHHAFRAFVEADSLRDSRDIALVHPELLNDQADKMMQSIVEAQTETKARKDIERYRDLIRRCREIGIVKAFSEAGVSEIDGLEDAISRFTFELDETKKVAEPYNWARAQQRLGAAYLERLSSKGESIRNAIQCFEQSLTVWTAYQYPQECADTHNSLGHAFRTLMEGDRSANLERAISHYEKALQLYSKEKAPECWAGAANNISLTYLDRIRGKPTKNIEQAISFLERALTVYTRQDFPKEWAMTVNNLANAVSSRVQGDGSKNLDKSITLREASLAVYTRSNYPREWVRTHSNLGGAFSVRTQGQRSENLERGIDHFRKALELSSNKVYREDWARAHYGLATAFSDRLRGDPDENYICAVGHCERSLEVYSSTDYPREYFRTLKNLANFHFLQRRWANAATHYQEALAIGSKLYESALTLEARKEVTVGLQHVARLLAYASVKDGNGDSAVLKSAVENLEISRARWLSEALKLSVDRPAVVSEDLWESFLKCGKVIEERVEVARSNSLALNSQKYVELSRQLEDAYAELHEVVQEIRNLEPDFMPEPSFLDVESVAKDMPVVYVSSTPVGGLAIIVHSAGITAVWLDELTDNSLFAWLRSRDSGGGWLNAYQARHKNPSGWFDVIDKTCEALWNSVLGPVEAALNQVFSICHYRSSKIAVLPFGNLGLLPLHLAWTPDSTRQIGRRYFLDSFSIHYAPSALILRHASRLAQTGEWRSLLAIGDPQPVSASKLPGAGFEVSAIASLFSQPVVLMHQEAELETVIERLPAANVLHLSCHGLNDRWKPLESGLLMVGDKQLTARDFLRLDLDSARFASLSACETGIVGTELPDEVIAMPTALLKSGFSGVLSSIWSVDDESTAMLMARFYFECRKRQLEPAMALREAQQWIRDSTNAEKIEYFDEVLASQLAEPSPNEAMSGFLIYLKGKYLVDGTAHKRSFEHPYWWGAFYLTGV